jgi:hypothetical protein
MTTDEVEALLNSIGFNVDFDYITIKWADVISGLDDSTL